MSKGEGSLEAPTRHPLGWQDPDFYDAEKLDAELRRVFDICHGCRRCFNLCDSFPRLFDMIDESSSGELDAVESSNFSKVVDACTLCDMCFMTKCPYVPPHSFDVDFPHLMLRARAVEFREGHTPAMVRQLTETDRNGKLAAPLAPVANWTGKRGNALTRPLLEKAVGIHRDAHLPAYAGKPYTEGQGREALAVNPDAPAFGRKALLYVTCFANYNDTEIADAARKVLAHNGVATELAYPECCGMPQLEQGDVARVADKAARVAALLRQRVDEGYTVVALTPSCCLMLKSEWPLLLPDNQDVRALAAATADISEYLVDIARKEGLAEGLRPLDGPVSVHIACHARAQNIGRQAEQMLRLLPEADLKVVERCSGHGGSWGIMKDNFETALKIGDPVFRQMHNGGKARYMVSECPLAAAHIGQGAESLQAQGGVAAETVPHPVILMARAWGLLPAGEKK